jgi:hypothetical protein
VALGVFNDNEGATMTAVTIAEQICGQIQNEHGPGLWGEIPERAKSKDEGHDLPDELDRLSHAGT